MPSIVLYRKYRPQSFKELIGQEHVVRTLSNALATDLVSHAYLFSGPRGSGKTTIARLFAKALNCENRKKGEFEPCNKCSSCLEIKEGRELDLVEIDAASHRGIDEMKELISGVGFTPTKSRYKVFIIDECHQLTKEASNALLKTLEEPPSHAIFILATTEIYKMIPTIISRCQRFDFRKLTLPEITEKLAFIAQKEGVRIEKAALELIALNGQGAFRDAEAIMDQAITFCTGEKDKEITAGEIKNLLGLVEINAVSQFTGFLAAKDAKSALSFLNEVVEKGSDLSQFSKALVNYLRQVLISKIMGPDAVNPTAVGLTKEEKERLQQQADSFKEEDLQKTIELFLEAENRMKYSSIPQLPLELATIESAEEKV
jgi:DNA polymerase-3 subunit gamma/tau